MGVIGINVKEDGNSTGNAGKREIIAPSPRPPPRPAPLSVIAANCVLLRIMRPHIRRGVGGRGHVTYILRLYEE